MKLSGRQSAAAGAGRHRPRMPLISDVRNTTVVGFRATHVGGCKSRADRRMTRATAALCVGGKLPRWLTARRGGGSGPRLAPCQSGKRLPQLLCGREVTTEVTASPGAGSGRERPSTDPVPVGGTTMWRSCFAWGPNCLRWPDKQLLALVRSARTSLQV